MHTNRSSRRTPSVVFALLLGIMAIHSGSILADPPQDAVSGVAVVMLAGRTTSPTLPGASVEVRVGEFQVVTATADEQGKFNVELPTASADELISIKACGTGDQSHICYLRLTDTLEHLQDSADDPLDIEIGALSAASTATYAVLMWTLGEEPVTFSQIEQIRLNFQAWAITSVTRPLLGVIHDVIELPAGISDTAALVSDREAFDTLLEQFLGSGGSGDTQALMEVFTGNSILYRRPALDFPIDVARLTSLSSTVVVESAGLSFFFDPGGEGEARTDTKSTATTWENALLGDIIFQDNLELFGENNRYVEVVTAADGEYFSSTEINVVIDGQLVTAEDRVVEVRLRALDLAEALPLAFSQRLVARVFPDNPELAGFETESRDMQFVPSTFVHGQVETPEWTPPAVGEVWVVPCVGFCVPMESLHFHDMVSFTDADTAEFERLGLSGNWSADVNSLGFSGQGLPDISGIHLGTSDEFSLLHFDLELDQEEFVSAGRVIRVDPDAQWDLNDFPIRFEGLVNDWLVQTSIEPFPPFVMHFNGDGTGWQANVDSVDDPEPEFSTPFTWEITPAGRLRMDRHIGNFLWNVREWELIRTDEGDHFVLEVLPFNVANDPDWDPEPVLAGPGRLNLYRAVDL